MIPGVNETVVALGTSAGKEIISGFIKKMYQRADHLDKTIDDYFKIDGREMTILCPEGKQRYSMAIIPKPIVNHEKGLSFNLGKPTSVDFIKVMGLSSKSEYVETCDDGVKLHLKDLSVGEPYILNLEYELENPRVIEQLVDKNRPRDIPHNLGDTVLKYEVSAQLRYLNILRENYRTLKMENFELNVDVAVHQDINTSIPDIFRMQMDALVKLSKKSGRSDSFKKFMSFANLQRGDYGGNAFSILKDLQDVFTNTHFKGFIDVQRDFGYARCFKSTSYFDTLPFETWPKYMRVITKTNLSLEKPAADGIVVYKHADFISDIEKIFEKNKSVHNPPTPPCEDKKLLRKFD